MTVLMSEERTNRNQPARRSLHSIRPATRGIPKALAKRAPRSREPVSASAGRAPGASGTFRPHLPRGRSGTAHPVVEETCVCGWKGLEASVNLIWV